MLLFLIATIEGFARKHRLDLVTFEKGVRKDDVARRYLARFRGREGVLFIGKVQEKVKVFRTERRKNRLTGISYPWVVVSSVMVNQYYFYLVDRDVGSLFLKFSSYFPYTAKLCLNGHEWLKRQLALLFTRTCGRVLRTGLSLDPADASMPRDLRELDLAMNRFINERLSLAA